MFKDRKFDGSWIGLILGLLALYFKFGGDLYDYLSNPQTKIVYNELMKTGLYFGVGFILYLIGSFAPSDLVDERKANKQGFSLMGIVAGMWGSMPIITHYYVNRRTGERSAGDISTNLFFTLFRFFAPVIFAGLAIFAYIVLLPVIGLVKFIYNWIFLGLIAEIIADRQLKKDPYEAVSQLRRKEKNMKAVEFAKRYLAKFPDDPVMKMELLCNQAFLDCEIEDDEAVGEYYNIEDENGEIVSFIQYPKKAIDGFLELGKLYVPENYIEHKYECLILLGYYILQCMSGDDGEYFDKVSEPNKGLVRSIYNLISDLNPVDPDTLNIQDDIKKSFGPLCLAEQPGGMNEETV